MHAAAGRRPLVPHSLASDLLESAVRVLRKTHWPTRRGTAEFFGNQLLVNGVAWTAGVVAVGVVRSFFEVRSFQNLWGLAAPHGRTLVSADDFRLIMGATAYSTGLLMMILVRHFVLRMLVELRGVRAERRTGAAGLPAAALGAMATPSPRLEGPEFEIDA